MSETLDILKGHKEIARYLGLSPRSISWHDEQGDLPTFKLGRSVCARKSALLDWVKAKERERENQKK